MKFIFVEFIIVRFQIVICVAHMLLINGVWSLTYATSDFNFIIIRIISLILGMSKCIIITVSFDKLLDGVSMN